MYIDLKVASVKVHLDHNCQYYIINVKMKGFNCLCTLWVLIYKFKYIKQLNYLDQKDYSIMTKSLFYLTDLLNQYYSDTSFNIFYETNNLKYFSVPNIKTFINF